MKRRMILLVFSVLSIIVLIRGTPVNAHTPGPISLSYDFESQELTVQVTHNVEDVNAHYIYQIVVEKNSVVVLTRDYTTQNTTSGMSASYEITAAHGDILRVTAKCIVSGQASNQITVIDPDSTETITTNGGELLISPTMIIAVTVIALGAVAVIVMFLRRR
ncbi:MAG: hypothetical protein ACFFDQ_08010 [Candidatus Thorarchaeota archaeon]